MIRKGVFWMALMGVWLCFIPDSYAAKYDLTLWRFCERGQDGWCLPDPSNSTQVLPDNEKFKSFAKQFAAVLAPKFHAPAETLGWNGWNLDFEFSLNSIPGGDHWDDALQGVERINALDAQNQKSSSSPGLLNTVQFQARKGLPYSLELGLVVTYLLSSEMVMTGVEAKFAFVEGLTYVPDMAVHMNYNHLFGSPDMDLDVWNWDLSLSYNWGVGGFIMFAPYTGYSLVYAIAAPHAVNSSFDPDNNDRYLMLDTQRPLIHRWFLGLRMIAAHINFTPEIIISSAKVYTYSFSLGANF